MMNEQRLKRGRLRTLLLGALLLAAPACQDLVVLNEIDPDRERATGNPSDVLALIGGGFHPNLWPVLNGSAGGLSGLNMSLFTYGSASQTSTLAGTGSAVYYLDLLEPRPPLENAASICSTICQWGPRDYWQRIHRPSSIAYDGLSLIASGMTFTEGGVDITPRAKAFAKFIQGWSWGYAALIFDRVHIVPETQVIPADPAALQALNLSSLREYPEAIAAAVASLAEAVAIAQANPAVVTFPSAADSPLWFGSTTSISNAQFIQMANTLAARLLVLSARTPQERAAVNWNQVLTLTANGVQPGNDFEFVLSSSRNSQLLLRTQNNTATGTTNARWNYRAIGPADQSGAYQTWINGPIDSRNRFNIVTPDRRITGATPTSNGSYTRYRADNNGFALERGLYLASAYQWARHAIRFAQATTGSNTGSQPLITADENRLMRAEALLRTGNVQGAVDLINVTRTRTHLGSSLPALTAAGVPTVGGVCVPRRDNGQCGTVMTALRYERMIELANIDALFPYADSRGLGLLPDGAFLHSPVPGNVLELYGQPIYTYGGVGNPGSAVYAPVN